MGESFASVLRRYRRTASLTQEALAERAAMSPTSIAALERGRSRTPRLSTVRQLGRALDLDPGQLADLSAAARGGAPDVGVPAPPGHPAAPPAGGRTTAPAGVPGAGARPFPALAGRRWRTAFVGRERELATLERSWRERCRLTEVVGEPGIGKTRLVLEMARRTHDGGACVLWGRCTEERLGPYLPFVDILRQLVAAADPADLLAAVGGRGELSRLLPELASRIEGLPTPTRAEAGTEQRLLFESVAGLLARSTPVLVVVDDFHWADDATTALLGYLARQPSLEGVVMVLTTRPLDREGRGAARLGELGRHADVSRINLGGMGGSELADLVGDLLGSPVPETLVESVATATEGNPFFAEEMTIHLVDSGVIVEDGTGVTLREDVRAAGVPERIRETVVHRLLSLSADALDLLSVGSVIGRQFELVIAASASDLEPADLVEAAEDGLMSGLVLESGPGRLAFSHALVQEAVDGRLSSVRKARIHRRVAQALEERSAADPAITADLARHWAAAAVFDPSATTVAAAWAMRAGDVALAASAADEAIARYEQASALWADSTAGHADALVRLGAALQYRGRAEEADERFRQAMRLAEVLGDPGLRAQAAIGLGRRYPYWETDTDRIRALEGALSALPPAEDVVRLTVMGLLVTQLINGFHPEEADRRDELSDHLAAVADDPSTTTEMLLSLGQTRIYDCIQDPAVLERVARRLAGIGTEQRDLRVVAGAEFAEALAAMDRGRLAELTAAADRYGATADQLNDPRERSQAATVRSTIAFIEGRYDDAARVSAEALQLGLASGDFNAELLHYAQGLLRAVDLGQAAEVLPLLLDASDYAHVASFAAGTALCAALAGEHELARRELARLMASGFEGRPKGADRTAPTAFLAHACVLVGAAEHAERLYCDLADTPYTVVRVGPVAGWWGPVEHHLGALSRLLGREDEAEAHLRRALALEERMGARPFAARTLSELAAVLRRTDPDRAAVLDGEAAARASAVGAAGIVAEVTRAAATR